MSNSMPTGPLHPQTPLEKVQLQAHRAAGLMLRMLAARGSSPHLATQSTAPNKQGFARALRVMLLTVAGWVRPRQGSGRSASTQLESD
jgi:hypothetical protein